MHNRRVLIILSVLVLILLFEAVEVDGKGGGGRGGGGRGGGGRSGGRGRGGSSGRGIGGSGGSSGGSGSTNGALVVGVIIGSFVVCFVLLYFVFAYCLPKLCDKEDEKDVESASVHSKPSPFRPLNHRDVFSKMPYNVSGPEGCQAQNSYPISKPSVFTVIPVLNDEKAKDKKSTKLGSL